MNEIIKLPFYAKLALVLLSLISLTYIFYIGQNILIPILMSFLFAILLRPIALFFKVKLRFPHVLAVMISVLLFVAVIIGVFTFISFQISTIIDDFDKIEKNITIHFSHIQQFIKENFQISSREQNKYLDNATKDSMEKGKEIIGTTLLSFTDTLLNITLIPIYTFLILLYRTHFMFFLSKLFKKEYHTELQDILNQIKVAVKGYIVGLILEMIAVSALTTLGFMIIGVKYAILLGIITGILNLIPYIGILFAGVLSIVASLTGTPDLSIMIGVIVVNIIVQLIDNNILVPMIVNSKVEINAFVSIIGIIIGGTISGISGMFLAIPILAILKVIFDRIESLEPWGYLMGDHLPKTYTWRNIKLPLFDSDSSTETIIIKTDIAVPIFTETTTETTTESDINRTEN
ncbi:AI-2E family transporter [Flavobacterium sp. GB2R13]|uniref:AI-2E family transporter n=1 Tax=Flavobacterium algoris TaxID=3398733 RepID=UPI003A853919